MRESEDWTDDELLRALQARDLNWSYAAIGKSLGRTRNGVAGALKRVDWHLAASEHDNSRITP